MLIKVNSDDFLQEDIWLPHGLPILPREMYRIFQKASIISIQGATMY